MTSINSLPEDIIIDCLSRVPRRYYPTLSLVSKYFRSLITSHELYARRVLLDRTEYCLYVTISNKSDNNDGYDRLYTLRQNFNSPDKKYSLVPVSSLPSIPPRGSYVAVDSKIFVIPSKSRRHLTSTDDTLLIDCRFHTAHHVGSMPSEVVSSAHKYSSNGERCVGGKEVGARTNSSDGFVMVVNQIPQSSVCVCQWNYNSDMTSDYLCLMGSETGGHMLNSKALYDDDGVSYFYSPRRRKLQAFDIRHIHDRVIADVKGVELMIGEDVRLSRTVIYGDKVVVFLQKQFDEKKEIWCAEIKVERGQKGEFCGRVEWCGCVRDSGLPSRTLLLLRSESLSPLASGLIGCSSSNINMSLQLCLNRRL